MQNATHFIEQFKSNDKLINGNLCEIKNLLTNLKHTKNCEPNLKTIAVFFIKFKNKSA